MQTKALQLLTEISALTWCWGTFSWSPPQTQAGCGSGSYWCTGCWCSACRETWCETCSCCSPESEYWVSPDAPTEPGFNKDWMKEKTLKQEVKHCTKHSLHHTGDWYAFFLIFSQAFPLQTCLLLLSGFSSAEFHCFYQSLNFIQSCLLFKSKL